VRHTRTWLCPYCSKVCPRHWNTERHIFSQHGLRGQPVDSVTGLTRAQSQARGRCGKRYFSGARKLQLQQGSRPYYYPYGDDSQNESDKRFWELADRFKDLKVLEILREMQRDIVTIMQQNNQIIALLVSFFNTRIG
jgi:hypothetical protein